jgi:hypothetical protein
MTLLFEHRTRPSSRNTFPCVWQPTSQAASPNPGLCNEDAAPRPNSDAHIYVELEALVVFRAPGGHSTRAVGGGHTSDVDVGGSRRQRSAVYGPR